MIPNGIEQIISYYGNPDPRGDSKIDQCFIENNLVKKSLPFPLRISWNLDLVSWNIYGHRLAVDKICQFFDEVSRAYGGYEHLNKENLDIWGGCFKFRSKTNSRELSTHSWGISFDYLPHLGPIGEKSRIPKDIIEIGESLGFENGGEWNIPDGMHFQLCRGY